MTLERGEKVIGWWSSHHTVLQPIRLSSIILTESQFVIRVTKVSVRVAKFI